MRVHFFVLLSCVASSLAGRSLFVSSEDTGLAAMLDADSLQFIGYLPQTPPKAALPDAEGLERYNLNSVSLTPQAPAPKNWFPAPNLPELASERAIAWSSDSVFIGYMQDGHGEVGRFDLENGKLLASLRITGRPKAVMLGDSFLYVAAEIPEAKENGILYAVDPGLSAIQSYVALDGHPWSLALAAAPQAPLLETASAEANLSPTASPSASPQAYLTPSSPMGAILASFYGQVLDAETQAPLSVSLSVDAINPRGRHFKAKIKDSSYQLPGLPWGRYTLQIQAPGYQSLLRQDLILAGQKSKEMNFTLEPSSAAQK